MSANEELTGMTVATFAYHWLVVVKVTTLRVLWKHLKCLCPELISRHRFFSLIINYKLLGNLVEKLTVSATSTFKKNFPYVLVQPFFSSLFYPKEAIMAWLHLPFLVAWSLLMWQQHWASRSGLIYSVMRLQGTVFSANRLRHLTSSNCGL